MKNLGHLADNNIIEAIRVHAKWQSPSEIVEAGGLILMGGQNNFPGAYRNCAVRTDPRTSASGLIDAARNYFAEKKRGFTVFSLGERDQDVEAQLCANGFLLRVDSPSLRLNAGGWQAPVPPLSPTRRSPAAHPLSLYKQARSESRYIDAWAMLLTIVSSYSGIWRLPNRRTRYVGRCLPAPASEGAQGG